MIKLFERDRFFDILLNIINVDLPLNGGYINNNDSIYYNDVDFNNGYGIKTYYIHFTILWNSLLECENDLGTHITGFLYI